MPGTGTFIVNAFFGLTTDGGANAAENPGDFPRILTGLDPLTGLEEGTTALLAVVGALGVKIDVCFGRKMDAAVPGVATGTGMELAGVAGTGTAF